MIQDVTDLQVYNRALQALELIYQLAKQIPLDHRKLKGQICGSAEGVPAQVAEGFAKRRSIKEFKRYLQIAMGSSDETITHARAAEILAKHIRTINNDLCHKIIREYKIISKQLNKLHKNWIDYRKF